MRLEGSGGWRWAAPAGLAGLAAADFLAQYLVGAASAAGLLHLPTAVQDFLTVWSRLLKFWSQGSLC